MNVEDELDALTYYELLRVGRQTSAEEIRSAFHRFALKYHPDNFPMEASEKRARASKIFQRGSEAYRVLLDSRARALYDQGLERGEFRLDPTRARQSEFPRRGLTSHQKEAEAILGEARMALRSRDWDRARERLLSAQRLDPDNPAIRAALLSLESRG